MTKGSLAPEPGWFIGDPTLLARDNIVTPQVGGFPLDVRFSPLVNGPKDRCLEPGWFVGDPIPLARDNILIFTSKGVNFESKVKIASIKS